MRSCLDFFGQGSKSTSWWELESLTATPTTCPCSHWSSRARERNWSFIHLRSLNVRLRCERSVCNCQRKQDKGKWQKKLPHTRRSTCLGPRWALVHLLPWQKQNGGQYMAIQYDHTVCTISRFPPLRKEVDAVHPLCVHPKEEDIMCTQLSTYGIRKSIVRLKMTVFVTLSEKVVWWNQEKMKEFWLWQLWSFR